MNAHTLITAGAIVALAAPGAATAKTIPVKRPATHVAVTKTIPAKHPAKHVATQVAKRALTLRPLCICVWLPVDRAKVQAEADFEAQYDQKMIAHGLDPWDWANDPAAVAVFSAGITALRAGTKTIDQILTEVDAAW